MLLFAVCLVVLGFQASMADDASDIARAAKRGTTNTVTTLSSRQKTDTPAIPANIGATRVSAATSQKTNESANVRERSAVTPRDGVVVSTERSRGATTAPNSNTVTSRSTAVMPRAMTSERAVGAARSAVATPSVPRTTTATTNNVPARTTSVSRGASNTATTTRSTARTAIGANVARTASTTSVVGSGTDYKKCREIFYNCMDEFCAAKDTQLKRCACSSRIHEFDNVKKQLDQVEDKMLDFSERLLTVNMDKEDAAAISIATEGEIAYNTKDTSASKKILDEISKKLKTNTSNSTLDRNLTAISLSLDMDAAFDNIDSMLGASTTTKEGTALYSAALPICREMVAEICDSEGVAIAESGYMMAIEQDCNTVSKAYSTLQDLAFEKVREGSALLDMSRLDIHQQRNSDDILTCKKKMIDMLSNTSVCGKDLGKCLDTTGRYIDPSTGEAFLTVDLANLSTLISRPDADQTWTSAPGNNAFVTFLNSKKKYLEPAMENCQDISDRVWTEFLDDALAQIKLAQEKKLEDMRQSCTSLTTQCLSTTAKSISEFDARALSIFGVSADKTVNEMCDSIKTACTALMETTGDIENWVGGMTEIARDKTYDTIIQTCREVGKACIIQTCKSISGNFGLCENIERSVNRKSIINRSACWNEVVQCVAAAGQTSITQIMAYKFNKLDSEYNADYIYKDNFDTDTYIITNPEGTTCDSKTQSCIYDICYEKCKGLKSYEECEKDDKCDTTKLLDCATCRIAEKIWGNCEFRQDKKLKIDDQNMIKIPSKTSGVETLLSWFASNTGTTDHVSSCMDTTCAAGFAQITGTDGITRCIMSSNLTSLDEVECAVNNRFEVVTGKTNCCPNRDGATDAYGNCCQAAVGISGFSAKATAYHYGQQSGQPLICLPSAGTAKTFVAAFEGNTTDYPNPRNILICVGGNLTGEDANPTDWPGGQTLRCNGTWVIIDETAGTYMSPKFNSGTQKPISPNVYYNLPDGFVCVFNFNTKKWGIFNSDGVFEDNTACNTISGYPTNEENNTFIKYTD